MRLTLSSILLLFGAGWASVHAQEAGLPPSTLAVRIGESWREWWNSARAPVEWPVGQTTLACALDWRQSAPGVEWAEARLAGRGEARRIRLIVVRLDPRVVRFRLDTASSSDGTQAAWSVGHAKADAVFAVNAGQFSKAFPWGWVVLDGWEYRSPGVGPLSAGVAFDSLGAVRWIPGDSLRTPNSRRGAVTGFQSFPRLLVRGAILAQLREASGGVDLTHRDARAALGETADGKILVALTRFDGAGGVLDFVPFGLTTPEMAAVMGALGARDAVMLDGGISSQMLVRTGAGTRQWVGLRKVPLALVAVPR